MFGGLNVHGKPFALGAPPSVTLLEKYFSFLRDLIFSKEKNELEQGIITSKHFPKMFLNMPFI